jgi:hypothetical protein
VKNKTANPINIRVYLKEWNKEIRPDVIIVAPIAAVKGHGLWSTM